MCLKVMAPDKNIYMNCYGKERKKENIRCRFQETIKKKVLIDTQSISAKVILLPSR